jgi:hypothetical protein
VTTTTSTIPAHAPSGTRRVLLILFGTLAVIAAVLLLAVGGIAAWAVGERDASGYLNSDTNAFSSAGHALVSENLDLNDVPRWVGDHFATVRIEAASTQPVFIGIARTSDVERYLDGVHYERVTDFETDPFAAEYDRVDGAREPALPASQGFWRVQAAPGTQSITWPIEDGDWSVVAMNADGSQTVAVNARFGARIDALGWITAVSLTAGGLVLLTGAGLIYLAARRSRNG